jgi:hypothetical protein
MLEATSPALWFQLTVASPFFTLASSRLLRAELLEEAGRRREAAEWRKTLAQRSPYELLYALGATSYELRATSYGLRDKGARGVSL